MSQIVGAQQRATPRLGGGQRPARSFDLKTAGRESSGNVYVTFADPGITEGAVTEGAVVGALDRVRSVAVLSPIPRLLNAPIVALRAHWGTMRRERDLPDS
jgi:hypothetical protein